MKTKSTLASKKSASTAKKSTTKPLVDKKMAAANDVQPETVAAAAAVTPENTAIALNQEPALKPEVVAKLKEKAANAKKEPKVKEEFLVKLRSKGDLLNALKADGILFLENGLWRLDPNRPDHKVHRVSKRRAVAFRAAELVVPTTQAGNRPNSYVLNLAKVAELAAAEKKAAKSAPAAGGSKAVTK